MSGFMISEWFVDNPSVTAEQLRVSGQPAGEILLINNCLPVIDSRRRFVPGNPWRKTPAEILFAHCSAQTVEGQDRWE